MWWLWFIAIMCMAIGFIALLLMLIDGHKVIVWRSPVTIEDDEQSSI